MRNQAAARLVGLHPTDWLALDLLDAIGPTPVGRLGGHLGLSRSAATAMADRLEAMELVARRPAAHDRRVAVLAPLDHRGVDYDAVDAELRDAMTGHADGFTDEELRTVLRFMDGATEILLDVADRMRDRHTTSTERTDGIVESWEARSMTAGET